MAFSPFLEQMTQSIVSSPAAIACIDSLLFFDTELMTNQLIGALLDELPVSLKKGTAVQHRYKLVFGHLRTEGLSDALELHLIIHQSRSFILSVPATRYITHKTLSEKQERTALIRVIRSGSLDEKAGGSSESGRIAEEQICMAEDALSEHDIRLNRLNTILRLVEKWIKMAKTLAKQPPPQSTPRPSPSERKALQTQFLAIAGTAPVTIPPILKAEQEMITLEGNQPLEPDVPNDRRRKRQVSLRTRKREEREDSKKKKDAKKELEANKLETSKTLNKDKRVTRKDRKNHRCMLPESLRSAMLQSYCQNIGGGHGVGLCCQNKEGESVSVGQADFLSDVGEGQTDSGTLDPQTIPL
ncbi:hypothetical protein BLNAU_2464 [Blattamonas nauphoetae]|uniref:Uncharacterized protein n=1 Tax=Blattamonas nauphoetae TaxID=2049346 RepID=A0ABQ9YG59_9EUKA|nr:hypothetical protein BLNAU_2464 [Blattamonas nauphoetae]